MAMTDGRISRDEFRRGYHSWRWFGRFVHEARERPSQRERRANTVRSLRTRERKFHVRVRTSERMHDALRDDYRTRTHARARARARAHATMDATRRGGSPSGLAERVSERLTCPCNGANSHKPITNCSNVQKDQSYGACVPLWYTHALISLVWRHVYKIKSSEREWNRGFRIENLESRI